MRGARSAAVLAESVVVPSILSGNVDRCREQKTAILKRSFSSTLSSPPTPSALSSSCPPSFACALTSYRVYRASRPTRLRESHSQSITGVWAPPFRRMFLPNRVSNQTRRLRSRPPVVFLQSTELYEYLTSSGPNSFAEQR